jgi:hypothetical protein
MFPNLILSFRHKITYRHNYTSISKESITFKKFEEAYLILFENLLYAECIKISKQIP